MICEGLVSRKYEEFSQFNNKMINKPISKSANYLHGRFSKEDIQMSISTLKDSQCC